jgi:hypothetical protein
MTLVLFQAKSDSKNPTGKLKVTPKDFETVMGLGRGAFG